MACAVICSFCVMLFLFPLVAISAAADLSISTVSEARVRFVDEMFEMAYTDHTAKKEHDGALQVAEQAVKARPVDQEWRRKAARSAEQAGKSLLALSHWLFLAELGDGTARQEALRLSRNLNEFPVRIYLLEGMLLAEGTDSELLKEYLAVSESFGVASEAYDFLASKLISGNRELLLKEQARLAELLKKPVDAVNALNKLALIRPLTHDETMQRAKLMFGQGDLERDWQNAFGVKRATVESAEATEEGNHTLLPPAEPETRRSFSWNGNTRKESGRRYFSIAPPTVGAQIKYELDVDDITVAGQKTANSSHTVTERLDLETKGFAYHPALLQYVLKFSPEFRQDIESRSGKEGDISSKGNSFNANYQGNAIVLNQKPYSLTVFAQQLETQSWANYSGTTHASSGRYGADLALKYDLLPTTIGFSSSNSEQSGYFSTSTDLQELHLMSRNRGISGDSSLTSTYSINNQVTNGTTNEIKTLNNAFNNEYQVTDDDKVRLVTNLQYMSQESLMLQNDTLQMRESLAWKHRENLQSQYGLNYRRANSGTTSSSLTSLDGRLTHRLYENLTTTAGITGNLNSYTGGKEKSLAGMLNAAYQRDLGTWGSLNLNAGATEQYTSRVGLKSVAQISNEPHTLSSQAEIFLDSPDVSSASIVVTNSAGIIVYVKDIDYQLVTMGSSVKISRLQLGAITDGQLIMVSYSYTRAAGYDDSLLTQNYGISLEFKRSLFLAYRYLKSKQTLLAGPSPERLNNADIHVATIRYDAGWSETAGVYEENSSNSDISYSRWEAAQTLRLRQGNLLQYNLRGYYGETEYQSDTGLKTTYGATTNLNWLPTRWLRFEMEGYYEQAKSNFENITNRGGRAGIEMNYRLWTARLSYKLAEQINKLSDYSRSNQVLQLELNRTMW